MSMQDTPLRPKRSERHVMRILTGYVDLINEGGNGAERAWYRNEWGVTSEWVNRHARKRKIKIPLENGGLKVKRGIAAVPNFYFGWV